VAAGASYAVAQIFDNWDDITDTVSDTWDSATDTVGDAWDSATDTIGDAWDSVTVVSSNRRLIPRWYAATVVGFLAVFTLVLVGDGRVRWWSRNGFDVGALGSQCVGARGGCLRVGASTTTT